MARTLMSGEQPLKNILIVEDDPFWQSVINRNVQKASGGCNVAMVTNAQDALDKLNLDHNFSLIIADQYLEGAKSGYELWWDCQRKGISTPFLLTSGNVDFPDEVDKDFPVKFVPKPFVAAELRKTLKDLLSSDPFSAMAWFKAEEQKINFSLIFVSLVFVVVAVYTASVVN
jgi:DNA-binding NtrC family response regulator